MQKRTKLGPRPRVLFVVPDLDVPPKKGYQVRCLGIADALNDRYETRVVAARSSSSAHETVSADQRPHERVSSFLRRLVDGAPLQSALFDGNDVASRIEAIARNWNPAAVVVMTERLPITAARLCGDRSRPLIIDVVDSMRLHMAERAARSRAPLSLVWRREARAFQRYARRIAKCASAVIAASETALSDYPQARVIANAAKPDRLVRPEPTIDLIFTGNLSYWPNVRAALELCEIIAPKVRALLPGARIVIAGS